MSVYWENSIASDESSEILHPRHHIHSFQPMFVDLSRHENWSMAGS